MRAVYWTVALLCWFGLYLATCSVGSSGITLVLLAPIIISPFMMWLTRQTLEHGQPTGIFNPRTQSWAFLFGDTIALPFTFFMLALSWRGLKPEGWYRGLWWIMAAFVAGVVIACVWHFVLDAPGYRAQGYGDLLGSPTKLWHDFVVYGSLSGALVYLGIPALLNNFTGYGGLALVGLIAWAGLGVADNTVHHLDPQYLHPRVSRTMLGRS